MERRLSATELARRLGDILSRVRYRGDSFVIERKHDPIARLVPVPNESIATLREALATWRAAGPPDPTFAEDLDRVGAADRPPDSQWAS